VPGTFYVEIRGLDKVVKDIEERYGKAGMRRRMNAVLKQVADMVVVPAIRREIPPTPDSPPWQRYPVKFPGPMRGKVVSKALRARPDEVGAVRVGIKTSHTVAVIRGTKPHDIPNAMGTGRTWHHPGAKADDIIGRAMSPSVKEEIVRQISQRIMRI